jgi:hypothetical protein
VATLVDGGIERRRAVGKLKNLADLLVRQFGLRPTELYYH